MPRYFILNKPPGCFSQRKAPPGLATVYDHVPAHYPRLAHVGRLDVNTEGLLLFTDDGRLAQALLNRHFPGRLDAEGQTREIEKVYHVKLRPRLDPDAPEIEALREPYHYPDGTITLPARTRWLKYRTRASWVEVIIVEGRHRQVRRLCARSGLQIRTLRRVAFGPLELGDLTMRWCRPLTADEVAACYAVALPCDPLPEIAPIADPLYGG